MKKSIILGAFILAATMANAAELELKLGADLYRDATKKVDGHNPVKAYPGASIGAEILFNEETPFRFGLGAEAKSQIKASGGYDGHYSFPVYAVGKYDLNETWYAVGRAGYAFASDDADDVDSADGGLYGALGLGKEFLDERFNVEFMYEISEYEYDAKKSDGGGSTDGYFHGFAIKFGYKFGGPSPAPAVMEDPEPMPVVEEVVEPEPMPIVEEVVMPPIPEEGIKFRESFDLNSSELSESGKTEIDEVAAKLSGFSGTLSVEGYTDDTGPEAYNKTLSEERAASVAKEFEIQLEGEDIVVESEGLGESNPLYPNDTLENRVANRRVEVHWTPAEVQEMEEETMMVEEVEITE